MFFAAKMVSIEPVYEQVTEVSSGNPAELGLWERANNRYIPTADTKWNARKVYYKTEKSELKEESERDIVFNTDEIKYMMDNPSQPGTTIVFVKDGKPAIIKGSFETHSKILLGFNRK